MKKVLFVLAALALSSSAAISAPPNYVANGDFSGGLASWTAIGSVALQSGNPFGLPTSPNGDPAAGVISSWGGDWGGPMGILLQPVSFTGVGTLSGELYAGTRGPDTWRDAKVDVLWNGVPVATRAELGDPSKWASDFPWVPFSVPVTGIGFNTLEIHYTVHYGEWTWTSADNIALVPEPGSMMALATGLMGFAGCVLRRKR